MIEEYKQYETVKTVQDLTEKQKSNLLRIGVTSLKQLGKNGQCLYSELCKQKGYPSTKGVEK
jgi:hypothetical protein